MEQIQLIANSDGDRGWYHMTGIIPVALARSVIKLLEKKGQEVSFEELPKGM